MQLKTSLLEFQVDVLTDGVDEILKECSQCLKEYQFKEVHSVTLEGAGCVTHIVRTDGSHGTLRVHPAGLVTLDVHEYGEEEESPVFTTERLFEIESMIRSRLKSQKTKRHPAIRRGCKVDCYIPTTDGRIIEYDFDRKVFEADSPYQNIKIMHSNMFGNVLVLDDDVNLAESDLAYTHAITGHEWEDYRGKTVLILGGGDGGILHVLRKQSPAFITMVDIDGIVINAAIKYLRGICHDSMDQLKGDNYEVLVEDCIPILEQYGKEGKVFDFVINDLTAVPVTTEPVGDMWDFMRKILDLSMAVLSPTGKYYTQGNGMNMVNALAMYEDQLRKLKEPVDFKTRAVCVPSYLEQWVFYEIWKKPATALKTSDVPNGTSSDS